MVPIPPALNMIGIRTFSCDFSHHFCRRRFLYQKAPGSPLSHARDTATDFLWCYPNPLHARSTFQSAPEQPPWTPEIQLPVRDTWSLEILDDTTFAVCTINQPFHVTVACWPRLDILFGGYAAVFPPFPLLEIISGFQLALSTFTQNGKTPSIHREIC